VLCLALKPNCAGGSILFSSIWGDSRLRISLSQIFERYGKRLIGLYEFRISGGFSGLANMTICENFQISGKYESLMIALYM